MLNAMMGAVAFQVWALFIHAHAPLCVIYTMAWPMLRRFSVMDFNRKYAAERMATMAQAVDAPTSSAAGVGWLLDTAFHLPSPPTALTRTIRCLGSVAVDPCHQTNPGPVSRDDFVNIFEHAFSGN